MPSAVQSVRFFSATPSIVRGPICLPLSFLLPYRFLLRHSSNCFSLPIRSRIHRPSWEARIFRQPPKTQSNSANGDTMPHIMLPDLPGIRGPMAFRPETSKPLNELVEVL